MLIGQLSDLHLKKGAAPAYNAADTAARFESTIDYISRCGSKPDIYIITGDISDDGSPDSYDLLKFYLEKLEAPALVIPGNHDNKENLTLVFDHHPYLREAVVENDRPYMCYAVDDYELRLIGLDTVTPGRHGGGLGLGRLKWLEKTLSEKPDRPTLVFMHHPPFASGIGHMDKEPFVNRGKLADILRRHHQVVRIACGHIHRSIVAEFAGRTAVVAPGVGMQIPVDLKIQAPSNFLLEPPGFLFHFYADRWQDGPTVNTYTVLVEETPGQYGSRHPFSD